MIRHIIKTQTFDRDFINEVFKTTKEMRQLVVHGNSNVLKSKIIGTLFYEPSTRTRLSFESAALRLGAKVISTENAREFSSVSKGESLQDTIRVMDKYCDCIVLRYHEKGGAQDAAHVSKVPVINAGDGNGQHPTQSLLDLFTIEDELGMIDGLKIVFSGDLKYGRTVHSLAYLLGKHKDIVIHLASPSGFEMPDDILRYLDKHNVQYHISNSLHKVIKEESIDAVYQTRNQKEKMDSDDTYNKEEFILTREIASLLDSDAIILHPLPRTEEIRYKD